MATSDDLDVFERMVDPVGGSRVEKLSWAMPPGTETEDLYIGVTADGDSLGVGAGTPTAENLALLDEANPSGAPHRIVKCTETTTRTPWEVVDVPSGGEADA